jgi:FkbM family methyltransferase
MSRVLIERTIRGKLFDSFMNGLVSNYLTKKSNELIEKRGFPIAVFGNDWIGMNIYLNGIYEDQLIGDLFSIVSKVCLNAHEMTIIDVGANIGNHSLQFARKFKKVISFEPNPRTYEILSSNTRRVDNIISLNVGLGREKTTLRLKETWNNMGGSSVMTDVISNSIVDVEVTTLDQLSASFGKIDVIKIDVEGMELDVLLGSAEVIAKDHPIVCLEQHESEFAEEFNETAALDYLRSLGYRLYCLKASKPLPWLIRRLKNVFELFYGKVARRVIVEYEKLPKNTYSMIFAIHPKHLAKSQIATIPINSFT